MSTLKRPSLTTSHTPSPVRPIPPAQIPSNTHFSTPRISAGKKKKKKERKKKKNPSCPENFCDSSCFQLAVYAISALERSNQRLTALVDRISAAAPSLSAGALEAEYTQIEEEDAP